MSLSLTSIFRISMILILSSFIVTGCSTKKKNEVEEVMIPKADTVREQFDIARLQEQKSKGIFDPEDRRAEYLKSIRAFKEVENRFPEDTFFTPVSASKVGDMYFDLEMYPEAEAQYRHVLNTYPEDEAVRVASLLKLGETLDELERPEEAQQYYKLLIDEFKTTNKPDMKQAVERARSLYRQIR